MNLFPLRPSFDPLSRRGMAIYPFRSIEGNKGVTKSLLPLSGRLRTLGRPRGGNVDARSRRRATDSTHVSLPKGVPRFTLQREVALVFVDSSVQIVTTFWTNMYEFSPLSAVRAGLLHGLVRSPSAPLSNTARRGSMNNQHTAPIPNRPLNNKRGKFQSLNHSTDFATRIGLITAPIWPAVFIVAPTTAECSRPMSSTVPQAGACSACRKPPPAR